MSLDSITRDVELLLEAHREDLGADPEMPVMGDWVLLVAVPSRGEPDRSTYLRVTPPSQMFHRTLGLLHNEIQRLAEMQEES